MFLGQADPARVQLFHPGRIIDVDYLVRSGVDTALIPRATGRHEHGLHRQPNNGAVALHKTESGRRKFRCYLIIRARHPDPLGPWNDGIGLSQ